MKKIAKTTKIILFVMMIFFCPYLLTAQTEEQKQEILAQYDLSKIKALQLKLTERARVEKEKALAAARANQWDIYKFNPDGSFDELVGLFPDGSPKYYALDNANAARSTRANHLNSGGSLGLNLNGQNMVGGVWDGGPVRTTHQEFGGRVIVGDGVFNLNNNSFHGTHVTGTVAGTGIQAEAKGMANMATVKTFDWNQDEEEVLAEIQNGLLLSNHSYGIPIANVPGPWFIGAYSQDARTWDEIHHVSPYYLMIVSAGNDGGNTNPSPTTIGFDKLNGNKNAKNNLVIANALDALVDTAGNLMLVNINSGSSQGPTDDFRIKPDITGNGTGLYSTTSTGDTNYTTLSGTSMSSPNVMGTLLLVQQHFNNVNQKFMRSSTLKALACNTADDAGNAGPDARFGWGLLNAKAAANAITNNGLNTWISEESLNNNQSFTMTVKSTAGAPLVATICWTDVPGIANSGVLNNSTPVLVNDLDIRITQGGETYYPWRLLPNATSLAVRNGDNFVDTVETIKIDNANGGDYTITVTHKGNLVDNKQPFGLVISGINSTFGMIPLGYDQVKCSNEDATFSLSLNGVGNGNVTLSTINAPVGATINFSANPLTANGQFTMNVSNLSNVAPGNYTIGVVGTNGTDTQTRYVNLRVLSNQFGTISAIYPANGQQTLPATFNLTWQTDPNAENYLVEVATDYNFNTIITSETTTSSTLSISNLESKTVYYWRVKPSNQCGFATNFAVASFQTGILNCQNQFIGTDFSDSAIGTVANSLASVPVTVSGGFIIGDVNVSLALTHTWVQDMTIYLDGPASIGSPRITLFQEPCAGEDNIDAVVDDGGNVVVCMTNPTPAIVGTVKPVEFLSTLNGLNADGVWKLQVVDNHNGDGGTIDEFSLNFCSVNPVANLMTLTNNGIVTSASSSKIILNTELNANTPFQTAITQKYTLVALPQLGTLTKNGVTLVLGDSFTQNDINLGVVSYSNSQTSPSVDFFKVDVLNNTSGWYPNTTVNIIIEENLSVSENTLNLVKIYPNPTKGFVSIQLPLMLNSESKINLIDIQGRTILSKENNQQTTQIDLSHLTDGIYFIAISYQNQKVVKKIILKK
jgi:subtilisin-like proprotein convertase family protein